jgi:guanyl-specific ribonuclease Sa
MRASVTLWPFLLISFLLLIACGGSTESTNTQTMATATTTPATTITTQTTPTVTTTTTPDASQGAPTTEELAEQEFKSPELPRITAEKLKQFIDNGEPLVVVDTRIEFLFNMGHLPQSIDIPPRPEDEQTTRFLTLPKDRLIIFYCD